MGSGFACGMNMRVPDLWLQQTNAVWEGPPELVQQSCGWLFLDLNTPLPRFGALGMYAAIYRLPVSPDGIGITFPGLLYAMEAGAMNFAAVARQHTLDRNTPAPTMEVAGVQTFQAPTKRRHLQIRHVAARPANTRTRRHRRAAWRLRVPAAGLGDIPELGRSRRAHRSPRPGLVRGDASTIRSWISPTATIRCISTPTT